MNILEKANEIVNHRSEEKEREYGPMAYTNEQAAKLATILCKKQITTEDLFYMQIALKLARQSWKHKEDNLLDAVAYIGGLNNFKEGHIMEKGDVAEKS
jgi:hypothetical protein